MYVRYIHIHVDLTSPLCDYIRREKKEKTNSRKRIEWYLTIPIIWWINREIFTRATYVEVPTKVFDKFGRNISNNLVLKRNKIKREKMCTSTCECILHTKSIIIIIIVVIDFVDIFCFHRDNIPKKFRISLTYATCA